MDEVAYLAKQAERIAAIGLLIASFEDQEKRIAIIEGLVQSHLISQQAGDILLDEFVSMA